MRYLLDTHTLVWFLENDTQLSINAKKLIELPSNEIFVSTTSLWEIAIKTSIGKMVNSKSNPDIVQELEEMSIVLLPINHFHISNYHRIPIISDHKDPFDRLLIATALTEELDIITVDEKFLYYKNQVKIIW